MTNMQASEFLKTVDYAAAANDRWLFLAAFCLLLLLCGVVIHWLVRQLQGLLADHKLLRDQYSASLKEVINTQNETSLQLAVCIDRNTAAMNECNAARRLLERNHNHHED